MGDVIKASEFLQGRDIIGSFVTVLVCIFILVSLGKTFYGWAMELYKKKNGIETEKENTDRLIQELRNSINDLKELHKNDIDGLKQKEANDISQIKKSIDELNKSVKQTNDKMESVSERDKHTNQAILRSDIIRIYSEIKENDWKITPIGKENMDKLFENYFANEGNGLIKDLKQEYDDNVCVDYSKL